MAPWLGYRYQVGGHKKHRMSDKSCGTDNFSALEISRYSSSQYVTHAYSGFVYRFPFRKRDF